MILTAFHGFCMALADSVPGVSGGTVAFILGFYERFLNALHGLFQGRGAERKASGVYLLKLGLGWGIGMASCVVLLSSLFEKNIYFMSSLFLGVTIFSIPFVAAAERQSLKNWRSAWFLLLGCAAVVALTLLRANTTGLGAVNYSSLQPLQFGYLFLSGAAAITAMVLPGLCALGFGVLAGIGGSIHAIRTALQKYRSQMVWLIMGLMLGSLYAIANGPASLDTPLPPLSMHTFDLFAFALGAALLLVLEGIKELMEKKEQPKHDVKKGNFMHEP